MAEDALQAQQADQDAAPNGRLRFGSLADKAAIEKTPYEDRCPFVTSIDALADAAARHSDRTAIAFQLTGEPGAAVSEMTYAAFFRDVTRLANALHAAGVRPGEPIALLLPNLPETMVALYAAQALGVVTPINPLLDPPVIASILAESGATALITLAPIPKADLAERAAAAVQGAPDVRLVVEVDIAVHVPWPKRVFAKLLRPSRGDYAQATIRSYADMIETAPAHGFTFDREMDGDSIGAMFHTGGTTGRPKLAQHSQMGMVSNTFVIQSVVFGPDDVVLSALPLFHIFSAYCMSLAPLIAGAKIVLMTPQGYRGAGVIPNFWKLIERHRATFLCGVPTALAALDQHPVDADVSSLQFLVSGSAPLPTALFRRFEENTGVKILEGYGLTEATCVTSCNPPDGERKIGTVGITLPYMQTRICAFSEQGGFTHDCETDAVGEICFTGINVFPGYKDPAANEGVFFEHPEAGGRWLRTGDLGKLDADGYLTITGRAKDLIIRGGHNIDPILIEEALAEHPAVAFVGAIGQPDAYAGELPCAYVELREGADAAEEDLRSFAAERVPERAARPVSVKVLSELPKTAVGKTFKPALRREAMERVYGAALAEAGLAATVVAVDDPALGLTAEISPTGPLDEAAVEAALSGFARPWRITP